MDILAGCHVTEAIPGERCFPLSVSFANQWGQASIWQLFDASGLVKKKKKWCCFTGRSGCWEFFTQRRNRNTARYVSVVCSTINYSLDNPDGISIFTFDGLQIQIISSSTKSLKVYFASQVPLKQTQTHNRCTASSIQSNGFARNSFSPSPKNTQNVNPHSH